MWLLLGAAIFLGGCSSLTDIDIGAGQIPPLTIGGQLEMPSLVAQSGVADASWQANDGTFYLVSGTDGGIRISAQQEIEFFTGDQMATLFQQYGTKADAVDRIDVQVTALTVTSADTGGETPLAPGITPAVVLSGQRLGGPGQRVTLDPAIRDQATFAFTHSQDLTLPLGIELGCQPGNVGVLPTLINISMTLQLILVVQALKAI